MAGVPTQHIVRIELCERPVRLARQIDYLLFGKPMAHPFLALLDERDRVLSEIHLVPYEEATQAGNRRERTRLNRIFEISTVATSLFGVDKMVHRAVLKTPMGKNYPTLHSAITFGPKQYSSATERQVIISGYSRPMFELWRKLRHAARDIDRESRPYDRFGWGRGRNNCQTGLAEILRRNGFAPAPLSGRYAAPGWHNGMG